MLRTTLTIALFASLSLPVASQTIARATVRIGCVDPASTDSLKARLIPPVIWIPGENGRVVMEVETLAPIGDWDFNSELPGFVGPGYFRWDGPNLFNTPGVDVLNFRFQVENPGTFNVRIHNRHDDPDWSQQNDCWVRMNNGEWDKFFENSGIAGVGVWSFNGLLESTGLRPAYLLTAGTHNFQISGRSLNFKIDRVHAYPKNVAGESTAFPESELKRERPRINKSFVVEVGDPELEGGFEPGFAQTLVFGNIPNANYPCGTVTSKFGEFLIALGNPKPMKAGPPQTWGGAAAPGLHTLVIPNDPALIGFEISLQGFMFQPGKSSVTDALDLVIGDI